MAVNLSIPFETLVQLIEQLPPEERSTLIERLQRQNPAKPLTQDLLVFDVGAWPEGLTLRREDEYGDSGR